MKKIIVYHGTSFDFDAIDLGKSKDRRDLARAFILRQFSLKLNPGLRTLRYVME